MSHAAELSSAELASAEVAAGTAPVGAAVRVDVTQLAAALAQLNRSTRRELQLPMGTSSIACLVTISDFGPIRLGDLAAHEGISPATLSRIVAVLEDDGFAERRVDPSDRRSAFLEATPSGKEVLARIRADRAAVLTARLERLTEQQRAALAAAVPAIEALASA